MRKAPETLSDIVPEYHSGNPIVRKLFLKRLTTAMDIGNLDQSHPMTVLDLGCGEGALLKCAIERYPRNMYVGWDVHRGIVHIDIPGAQLARVDILTEKNIPEERFDRVFCLDVLEHFPQLGNILARIRRMLKMNGLLIVSEPTENWLYRLGRLIVKGTVSADEGPAAGPHYHDAAGIHREIVTAGFDFQDIRVIPFRPFDLFHITRFGRGQ